jgi:hypothetical protein
MKVKRLLVSCEVPFKIVQCLSVEESIDYQLVYGGVMAHFLSRILS